MADRFYPAPAAGPDARPQPLPDTQSSPLPDTHPVPQPIKPWPDARPQPAETDGASPSPSEALIGKLQLTARACEEDAVTIAWAQTLREAADALDAERARADRAEEERDRFGYALYHADFAEIGLTYPDDGSQACIGSKPSRIMAAKRLRDHGLVTMTDSPAGPLVAWVARSSKAPARGAGDA